MSKNTQFKLDISKFIAKAGANAEALVRKVSLDLMKEVDLRSPVDEGRFRGNNNLAVRAPDTKTSYPDDKSGAEALGRAQARLAEYKLGDTVYITNSLPYARVIEFGEYPGDGPKTSNGFSTQSPQGVYGVSALSFQKFVKREAAKLK